MAISLDELVANFDDDAQLLYWEITSELESLLETSPQRLLVLGVAGTVQAGDAVTIITFYLLPRSEHDSASANHDFASQIDDGALASFYWQLFSELIEGL